MAIRKPASIRGDAFKNAKWNELTKGRNFRQSDVPTLTLLCQWYAVAQRCIDDMDELGGQVAYQNDLGDLRALPQIATMKQASAEIRQLCKQLGINDSEPALDTSRLKGGTVIDIATARRKERKARAAS